jgi:molybdenum cofactor biosynthesis protein B
VGTDESGRMLCERLTGAGHRVAVYEILPDEPGDVRDKVRALVAAALDVVVLTGGTGIAPRDTTYEAVSEILEKRLDGFGELFRSMSYAEIGSAAMLSRAAGGVIGCTAVFSIPGSTPACALAMDRLILPEIGHIVSLLRKPRVPVR